MEEHIAQLLNFFKALGQKERLAIAGQLLNGPVNVPELHRRLGIKEMELQRHLALMQELGLVQGNEEAYWFDVDQLHQLNRTVWQAVQPPGEPAIDSDSAVVQRFVRDGRLLDLPIKESKLEVVLRWVVAQIPADKTFSEREISALLTEFHDDYALLRRYLVDFGLMARDQGIYWRVDQAG